MIIVARIAIWGFFLLIVTRALEYLVLVWGSPLRPAFLYFPLIAIIAGAAVGHARGSRPQPILARISAGELALLSCSAALTLWILLDRGPFPYALRMAIWPAANVAMGAALFYLVRFAGVWETVRHAAAAALALQCLALFIDLWIPGAFAEWPPRPAGFPQNANLGAELIVFLIAFLLPARKDAPRGMLVPFATLAAALVFVTLSRSGLLLFGLVAAIGIFDIARHARAGLVVGMLARSGLMLVPVVITLGFSPTLRDPVTIAIWHSRVGIAPSDLAPPAISAVAADMLERLRANGLGNWDRGAATGVTSQEILDRDVSATDTTGSVRLDAVSFFLARGNERPLFGYGTGYGENFKVPAHNAFVALFADNGAPAVVMFGALLALLLGLAITRGSPALLAVTLVGTASALFSHLVLVEPWFIVLALAALGRSAPASFGAHSPNREFARMPETVRRAIARRRSA
jgi:hypothetical protein